MFPTDQRPVSVSIPDRFAPTRARQPNPALDNPGLILRQGIEQLLQEQPAPPTAPTTEEVHTPLDPNSGAMGPMQDIGRMMAMRKLKAVGLVA